MSQVARDIWTQVALEWDDLDAIRAELNDEPGNLFGPDPDRLHDDPWGLIGGGA